MRNARWALGLGALRAKLSTLVAGEYMYTYVCMYV